MANHSEKQDTSKVLAGVFRQVNTHISSIGDVDSVATVAAHIGVSTGSE